MGTWLPISLANTLIPLFALSGKIVIVNQAEILRELKKFPQKQLGQHFLTDEKVLNDIVEAGRINSDETIVEIGPGLGVLTFELVKFAKAVIAIEADRELAEYLRRKNISQLTVITGDALQIDWSVNIQDKYKIIANIPYSITSPLLRKVFLLEKRPELLVLLIQKEVAQRLIAEPGNNSRGFLTILLEANASARIIRTVKPGSFYPHPEVDSAIIEVVPHGESLQSELFWPAVEAAFSHKRQTLINGLMNLPVERSVLQQICDQIGLHPMARPADLSLEEWIELSKLIKDKLR